LNVRRFIRLSIILAALAFYSGQGWADSWQQVGSARVSTEYDTNPAMSPTYRGDVWRALLEPSYTLMGRVGANELQAGLALQIARSSNQTLSQDREDPRVFLDWRRQSDAGEFGMSAKYDEVATRTAEIDNTGPGFADSTRASRTMSGSWNKALSERSTLTADGAYSDVSYKGGALGGTFVDYATRSGDMMFSYAWSERSAPFLKMSYADYEPTSGNPLSRSASAILGWNWKVSDYLEGTLQVGKSKVSDTKMGSQGTAAVQYTGQRTGLVLNAGRQVSPSGLGGFVTVDQANGNWSYALNERSKTGIDLGWQNNHFVTDIINRTAGAWLQHDLNSFWGARTYYQHRIIEQGGVGRAFSNILGITLVYTHADF
jgi:hypothetical protein